MASRTLEAGIVTFHHVPLTYARLTCLGSEWLTARLRLALPRIILSISSLHLSDNTFLSSYVTVLQENIQAKRTPDIFNRIQPVLFPTPACTE